jgi:hypothetical protein
MSDKPKDAAQFFTQESIKQALGYSDIESTLNNLAEGTVAEKVDVMQEREPVVSRAIEPAVLQREIPLASSTVDAATGEVMRKAGFLLSERHHRLLDDARHQLAGIGLKSRSAVLSAALDEFFAKHGIG